MAINIRYEYEANMKQTGEGNFKLYLSLSCIWMVSKMKLQFSSKSKQAKNYLSKYKSINSAWKINYKLVLLQMPSLI